MGFNSGFKGLRYSALIFVEKIYIKCKIWRVAVRLSYIKDARFLKVNFLLDPVLQRIPFHFTYTGSPFTPLYRQSYFVYLCLSLFIFAHLFAFVLLLA